jgi:hypothetical protein
MNNLDSQFISLSSNLFDAKELFSLLLDLREFADKLQVLNDHFMKYIKTKVYFSEIAIIAGNTLGYGQKRELNEKLQKNIFKLQLRLNCRKENIKLYDMNDILKTLESRHNSIKNVIKHIIAIRRA